MRAETSVEDSWAMCAVRDVPIIKKKYIEISIWSEIQCTFCSNYQENIEISMSSIAFCFNYQENM